VRIEVKSAGVWYQATVSEPFYAFALHDRVEVSYDGYCEDEKYEEIEKNGREWEQRLRAPLPALDLYGLECRLLL